MVTRSKMFSRAAAGWILFFLLTQVYSFFMSTWHDCKLYDEKFGEVVKALFTEKSTREGMWLWVASVVAMLVLTIALFLNNRGAFLFGALLNCGVVGYQVYKVIEFLSKQKKLKWTGDFTIKFIVGYAIVALAALFVLLMALCLLSGSSAAKGFGILTAVFAFIGLVMVILLDILPYTSKDWKSGSVQITVAYADAEVYFTGLIFIMLVVKWAYAWASETEAKAKNAVPNGAQVNPYSVTTANPYLAAPAAGYANPTAALYSNQAAPQQATYQAPQQAAYQAPQQAAPQAPQQAAYQAPQQAAPQAPQQAVYQAPQQTAQQAPQQAVYQAPQQTAYQAPQQAVPQAPQQAAYQAPEQTAPQAPEQPVYQAPKQAAEDYATYAGDVADNYVEAVAETADDFSAWTGGVVPGAVNEAAAAANSQVAEAVNAADNVVDETLRQ